MSYENNTLKPIISTDDNTYFHCPAGGCAKLTTDNFSRWKTNIVILLTASRAIEIVLAAEEPPQNGNSVAAFNAMDKYLSRKALAYGMLVGSCTRATRAYVQGLTEPSEIWATLHARLDTNSSTAISTLVRQFNREKPLPRDGSIGVYLERLRVLRDDLMDTYSKISDDAYIDKILTTIPEAFYTVRDRVYGNPGEFRNITYVVNALLEHEKMKRLDDQVRSDASSLTSGTALLSVPYESCKSQNQNHRRSFQSPRGKYRARFHSGSRSHLRNRASTRDIPNTRSNNVAASGFKGTCWHCNRTGHRRDRCRQYQREVGVAAIANVNGAAVSPSTGPSAPRSAAYTGTALCVSGKPAPSAMEHFEDVNNFAIAQALMVSNASSAQVKHGWLIDSWASHNLCPDRGLLTNLRVLARPILVYLGDGTPLPGIAKGKIRLFLPSGTVLDIEALFVPRLRAYLLSVSALAELGVILSFHPGGRCFVGTELVGRTVNHDGIYHFLGKPHVPSPASHLLPANTSTSIPSASGSQNNHPFQPLSFLPREANKINVRLQSTSSELSAARRKLQVGHSFATLSPSLHLWHQRLGHLGMTAVSKALGSLSREM